MNCPVCLSVFSEQQAFTLSGCGCQHHSHCLKENISFHLNNGAIQVACYTCGVALLDSDIHTVIGESEMGSSILARLKRLRVQKADPSVRFCPSCLGPVPGGDAKRQALSCGGCGQEFCFIHSTAHPPGLEACKLYVKEQEKNPDTLLSLETIRKNSRPCPNTSCGTQLERVGGCNSMLCSNCGITFCWLCGKQISEDSLPVSKIGRYNKIQHEAPAPKAPKLLPSPHALKGTPSTHTHTPPSSPLPSVTPQRITTCGGTLGPIVVLDNSWTQAVKCLHHFEYT